MTDSRTFVYLASAPFSGSTLFSFMAGLHPDIATVGEMTGPLPSDRPDVYLCSCGLLLTRCPFWNRIAVEMKGRGFAFDIGQFDTRMRIASSQIGRRLFDNSLRSTVLEDLRNHLLVFFPRRRQRLKYLISRNLALAEAILSVTGKSVFFDASKNPMAISHLSRQESIRLQVVHLVRDVRGASYSKRKNQGDTSWHRNLKSWVTMNRNIERQLTRLPTNRWIRLRYEDLCTDPQGTLARFHEFCGVDSSWVATNIETVERHIVGNRMRLASNVHVQLDETWRRALTRAEQDHALEVAGRLHASYGYSKPDPAKFESACK